MGTWQNAAEHQAATERGCKGLILGRALPTSAASHQGQGPGRQAGECGDSAIAGTGRRTRARATARIQHLAPPCSATPRHASLRPVFEKQARGCPPYSSGMGWIMSAKCRRTGKVSLLATYSDTTSVRQLLWPWPRAGSCPPGKLRPQGQQTVSTAPSATGVAKDRCVRAWGPAGSASEGVRPQQTAHRPPRSHTGIHCSLHLARASLHTKPHHHFYPPPGSHRPCADPTPQSSAPVR